MKLVDKLMVYKGQYGYSTLLKNQEDKLYVQVGFRKGQEPLQEKAMIDIKDGFLSFYKDKNGAAKPKIVVLDFTEIETQNFQPQEPTFDEPVFNPFDDDLPF
jgi:hypothetical protein